MLAPKIFHCFDDKNFFKGWSDSTVSGAFNKLIWVPFSASHRIPRASPGMTPEDRPKVIPEPPRMCPLKILQAFFTKLITFNTSIKLFFYFLFNIIFCGILKLPEILLVFFIWT